MDTDDRIECLECGRWFRSVASHVYPAHGLRADEYRLQHDLPMNDPLCGTHTADRKRAASLRRLAAQPDLMEIMWARKNTVAAESHDAEGQKRTPAQEAAMARRLRAVEAQWVADLDRNGWSSWQDAADWAIDHNVGWLEVAQRLGYSERPVQLRAQLSDAPVLDRRITPRQERLLALARERFDQSGSLHWASPLELSDWLSAQRRLAARGVRRRVHNELDKIDPAWAAPRPQRTPPPCTIPECSSPSISKGLCRSHYHREVNKQLRDSVVDAADQIECLECGESFRSVGTHVHQVHGMSAAAYRERHGIPASAPLSAAAVRQNRQAKGRTAAVKATLRQAQVARWGGTLDQLWAKRFERAGWSGWDDLLAWTNEHNKGWGDVAALLGCSKNTVRRAAKEANVQILPPLSDNQIQFLERARTHAAQHGNLTHLDDPDLARWLAQTRRAAKLASSQNRCYLALEAIDPRWRSPHQGG